ncbi:MAG: SGNH/GDSL hydrolase family protein [Pseudochelatococcus sp.]|jgi:lysophospholipase L1-like esterase|uniref:SGNH/GDSL hydrolase family protein n=1 Tax=Pseudochelatococcus sp. TaxID=2020869 RepID=UPI003D8E76D0
MHARSPFPAWFRWPLIAPRGLPPYGRITKTLIGVGILAMIAIVPVSAFMMTEAAGPHDGYALVRLRTVEAQAEQIEGDYILLAGDSHTERLLLPALCGLPTLNAGLSGATLADMAPFLSAAKIRPPKLTLLIAGTNDANLKRKPDTDAARAGFRENLDTLLSILHWKSTRVVVSQVPPLREPGATGFSPAAVRAFDAIVGETCDSGKCRRVVLFPPADGLSPREPLHAPDGIHLNRLADRILARSDEICG